MNKIIAVILGVIFLATPTLAKAGIFGSSYEGCVDPSDDMAGYILEKASGTDLTRTNIEHALEIVPTGIIEHISYGDIFKWLKTTENAADCFAKRNYLDGLKILGKHTGEFAALTTLEGSASLVAPGLFLPGTLFKWYIDTLVKTLATNGFNDQITLYIAAMEKCKEEGATRDFCQQEIKSGNYSFAYFHPTGYLVAVDSPRSQRIVKDSEIKVSNDRASKMFASFGLVLALGITSGEFYDGALTIYDSLVAKYDETFNKIESAAYEKVIAIAKSNPEIDNKDGGGFFSNLWKKIVNLFTKNDKNTQLPAQISDAVDNVISDNNIQEEQPARDQSNERRDWKEYTSQKLNFSIKYPSNWFKLYDGGIATDEYFSNNEDIGSPLEMGKDGIWLTIRAEKSSTSYEKVFSEKTGNTFKDSSSYLITKLGDMTINGKSAVKFAREASPEVKAEGTEYGYEIVYAVQNGNSIYSITFLTLGEDKTTATKNSDTYELIATSFKSITPATSSAKVIKPWKLVSGDPTNTCTAPTYAGEVQVRGWYKFEKTYQEEQWVLHIADEDIKILPLYDYGQKINNDFNSTVVLMNASPELEQKLKKASKDNPEIITLKGYELYCEGGPAVSVLTPTVKSNASASAQNPQTSPSQSSEKVVRVSGDVWLKNNKEGTPPLGVITGIADTDTSLRAWKSDSDNPDLRRGDHAKYLSESSRIADPLEKFPQSTRAIEVELSNGKRGWIVAEWSYKGNSMVLAEVISQSDLTKPISVEPVFPDIEGKWNGSWVEGEITGNFEINIEGSWWLYGQGSETTETETASFTISGSLFGNKIFFYKNYPNRQIYYEGSVSGNTANGTWQQSSWFASSSGTWSMVRK